MKFLVFKRKTAVAAACVLAAALMFTVVNHPAIVGAAATTRQFPIYCVQRDQKMVAISFDAAWGEVRVRRERAGQSSRPSMPRSSENVYVISILPPSNTRI